MAAANTPFLLLSNTALNTGDNVFPITSFSPGPSGQSPTKLMLVVRAHSLVTGPLTLRVEYSPDGTNWFGGDPAQTMTAINAAGGAAKSFDIQFPIMRVVANLAAGTCAMTLWCAGV